MTQEVMGLYVCAACAVHLTEGQLVQTGTITALNQADAEKEARKLCYESFPIYLHYNHTVIVNPVSDQQMRNAGYIRASEVADMLQPMIDVVERQNATLGLLDQTLAAAAILRKIAP